MRGTGRVKFLVITHFFGFKNLEIEGFNLRLKIEITCKQGPVYLTWWQHLDDHDRMFSPNLLTLVYTAVLLLRTGP